MGCGGSKTKDAPPDEGEQRARRVDNAKELLEASAVVPPAASPAANASSNSEADRHAGSNDADGGGAFPDGAYFTTDGLPSWQRPRFLRTAALLFSPSSRPSSARSPSTGREGERDGEQTVEGAATGVRSTEDAEPLLYEPIPALRDRPTVVFDLDATLVASGLAGGNALLAPVVQCRPGAGALLVRAACHAELVVWTAANQRQALHALHWLAAETRAARAASGVADPGRGNVVSHCVYHHASWVQPALFRIQAGVVVEDAVGSAHARSADEAAVVVSVPYCKPLRRLGRPLARCLIIDDCAANLLPNPRHGVLVPPFEGDLGKRAAAASPQQQDTALARVEELLRAFFAAPGTPDVPEFLATCHLVRWSRVVVSDAAVAGSLASAPAAPALAECFLYTLVD